MASPRFNYVFFALMLLAAVVAFLVKPEFGNRYAPQFELLLYPVARPVSIVASAIRNRIAPPALNDIRTAEVIQAENRQLRAQLAELRTRLDEFKRQNVELAKLGEMKDRCKLVPVIGTDAGTRESLALGTSTLEGIRNEMYVLYPGGLVGQIQRAGAGGAMVRLITDPAFRVVVRFVRFGSASGDFNYLGVAPLVVEGLGNGAMVARGATLSSIGYDGNGKPIPTGDWLREGDVALLQDKDCPGCLQGQPLAQVTRVTKRSDAQGFAEIRLAPGINLKKLREVMVMVREQ
jgi:cell shape-determining protein MreC